MPFMFKPEDIFPTSHLIRSPHNAHYTLITTNNFLDYYLCFSCSLCLESSFFLSLLDTLLLLLRTKLKCQILFKDLPIFSTPLQITSSISVLPWYFLMYLILHPLNCVCLHLHKPKGFQKVLNEWTSDPENRFGSGDVLLLSVILIRSYIHCSKTLQHI
jgi:hypothetical protein